MKNKPLSLQFVNVVEDNIDKAAYVAGEFANSARTNTTPVLVPSTIKANVAFVQFVNSIMVAENIQHSTAWLRAAQLKPDLNTMMHALGATRARVQFLNERLQAKATSLRPNADGRVSARSKFHEIVHSYMDKYSVDYDAAYKACHRQFANAAAAMTSGSTPAVHSKTDGSVQTAPLANPGLLALFSLPVETPQETFAAAYEANGRQHAVINPAKIFDGLVNYFMDKKSLSHDTAIDSCKNQFSDLWSMVKEQAKAA